MENKNFVAKYWEGGFTLGYATLIYIGFNILAVLIPENEVLVDMDGDAGRALALLLILLLFFLCMGVLQIVGYFRSAKLHTSRGGSLGWQIAAFAFLSIQIVGSIAVGVAVVSQGV